MDKYEFNLRIDQIKKKIASEDFETAMKIADTIDWRRVRNINILSMVSGVYEKNGEYQEAKDILLLAFERAPMGKRLLYKLAELAIKEGSPDEAEDYYREFCELAPEDPRQYILRYLILGAKGAPVEQLIHTLEQYCNVELDEKWLYELAELYNAAHMEQLCVMTCDKIMLMFAATPLFSATRWTGCRSRLQTARTGRWRSLRPERNTRSTWPFLRFRILLKQISLHHGIFDILA